MTIKHTWFGHATQMLDVNGTKLLVDPFFSGNPAAPITADKAQAAPAVPLTHVLLTHSPHCTANSKQGIAGGSALRVHTIRPRGGIGFMRGDHRRGAEGARRGTEEG